MRGASWSAKEWRYLLTMVQRSKYINLSSPAECVRDPHANPNPTTKQSPLSGLGVQLFPLKEMESLGFVNVSPVRVKLLYPSRVPQPANPQGTRMKSKGSTFLGQNPTPRKATASCHWKFGSPKGHQGSHAAEVAGKYT